MSKTDKTKPFRVRAAEHQPVADHDHTDGVCDLPSDPRVWVVYDGRPHCRWSTGRALISGGSCCGGCGCRNGTCGTEMKREDRRRQRHDIKRELTRDPDNA